MLTEITKQEGIFNYIGPQCHLSAAIDTNNVINRKLDGVVKPTITLRLKQKY